MKELEDIFKYSSLDERRQLAYNKLFLAKETVPEGLVQATQFIYVNENDNKIVGMIQVRHYFNDFLEKYGGHIGYSVRPSERRKGYAKEMQQHMEYEEAKRSC